MQYLEASPPSRKGGRLAGIDRFLLQKSPVTTACCERYAPSALPRSNGRYSPRGTRVLIFYLTADYAG